MSRIPILPGRWLYRKVEFEFQKQYNQVCKNRHLVLVFTEGIQ